MQFTIRFPVAADKDSWLELWHGYTDYFSSPTPDEIPNATFLRFLDEKSPICCLVAEDTSSNALIGFAAYVYQASTWSTNDLIYLQDLFVVAESRNAGVGRELIEKLYEEAERTGTTKVYWHAHRSNDKALRLYSKLAVDEEKNVYRKYFPSKKA